MESSYGNKGQKVVDMNHAAVDKGVGTIVKITVPAAWKDAKDAAERLGTYKRLAKMYEEVVVRSSRL